MEMKKIWQICKNHTCDNCPFYKNSEIIAPEGPIDVSGCLIEMSPVQWDLVEINRRLRKYGK